MVSPPAMPNFVLVCELSSPLAPEWVTRNPGATHGSTCTIGVGRSIANPNAAVPRVVRALVVGCREALEGVGHPDRALGRAEREIGRAHV